MGSLFPNLKSIFHIAEVFTPSNPAGSNKGSVEALHLIISWSLNVHKSSSWSRWKIVAKQRNIWREGAVHMQCRLEGQSVHHPSPALHLFTQLTIWDIWRSWAELEREPTLTTHITPSLVEAEERAKPGWAWCPPSGRRFHDSWRGSWRASPWPCSPSWPPRSPHRCPPPPAPWPGPGRSRRGRRERPPGGRGPATCNITCQMVSLHRRERSGDTNTLHHKLPSVAQDWHS